MSQQEIITFLFSDIEHSTRLAQQHLEKYPELLEHHRSVIRETIKKYNGQEVDTAGDGFFITFQDAKQAVSAAAEIQKKFYTESWAKKIGLKVRMGLHTGIALSSKTGYTGVEVHFASRICNAAFGGQVLLSKATQEIIKDILPNELQIKKLGSYVLKDFDEPVEIFQLNITGIINDHNKPRIDPDEKKIAVLPFLNMSNDAENEYLGNGIAEEIIIALGKVQGLRVASRSSSFSIKKEGFNAKQIGQKLNVNSVLEGRVKSSNGNTRISVELVDTKSGLNIWSGQYDSKKEDLLETQKDITRKITESLECNLIPEQLDSLNKRQSKNAEAYDYYLRGRRFYLQFSTRGSELALQMFDKAIESDKNYALAYAGIADCYSYQFQHKSRLKETLEKADKASEKAIKLDPNLAEGYVSRGIVMSLRQKFPEAEKLFLYAIERDPTLFLGWYHYGRTCFVVGKLDKAARAFEQANRVEPEDYQSILLAAQAYDDIGSKDLAKTLRQRGVAIAEKWIELNPGDTRALYLTANALVFLDQKDKSKKLLQRALLIEPEDSMLLYNAGCIYALLEMKNEALNCLERSYQKGLTLRGWYENDSNLESIRNEPRFIELLAQLKDYSQ